MSENFVVARAAKHMWEEPCISGTNGSGTVFFSGCNLRCAYCQNYEISHGCFGKEISDEHLMKIFDNLIESGVHNINLVNPTHYAVRLAKVLSEYHSPVPVVYNSSGYESVETLKMLEGLVDIYLPDFKYISGDRAEKYSHAPNYFERVSESVIEMKRQMPSDVFSPDGMMQKGLIVRHLILPKNTNQSLKIIDWIKENLGKQTIVSLMAQYTPCGQIENFPELQRKITAREYEKVVSYLEEAELENAFIQQLESAEKQFIPSFDLTGIA
ncbi:MAG: 4Fe-4S cluster-binding domain-containing protein [Faecalibacterium sp.]|nr:4Fe-4S cluster-binding domain-containing protein [Ruminococcus sp.]MCM1392850.1 4Fe-4S cluster-binding domain-containing protein [Ruminococcus sp.]MCM1486411.1 4Fe-4S cluster-binding domain-containing protein [Faecalibacterium sp.]